MCMVEETLETAHFPTSRSIPFEAGLYVRSPAQRVDPGVSRMGPHVVQPLGVADGSARRAESQRPLSHP